MLYDNLSDDKLIIDNHNFHLIDDPRNVSQDTDYYSTNLLFEKLRSGKQTRYCKVCRVNVHYRKYLSHLGTK